MKQHVFFTLLCFLVGSNMSVVFAKQQITPECTIEMEGSRYIVHFTLPEYQLE